MVNATGRVPVLMEEDRHVPRRMIRPVTGEAQVVDGAWRRLLTQLGWGKWTQPWRGDTIAKTHEWAACGDMASWHMWIVI